VTFRIADTFTASLARLTTDEQNAAKTIACELQLDPSHPSMQFHSIGSPVRRTSASGPYA
jgi:hypothetical protein